MATLKEHQAAMVDLLANGSGIPASASRLAHAMHDVLEMLTTEQLVEAADWRCRIIELASEPANPTPALKELMNRRNATTPGLNDKALSKREKALKTDSQAKWPTPAEQRVKELENTIRQLKANNAKLKSQNEDLRDDIGAMASKLHTAEKQLGLVVPEQAGCRKPDTQVCNHIGRLIVNGCCTNCGADV